MVALRRQILPPLHRDLARSLGMQANVESRLGSLDNARSLRAEAIALLRAQLRPDRLLRGTELTNQATEAFRDGELGAAAAELNEARGNQQPTLEPGEPSGHASRSNIGIDNHACADGARK